MIHKKFDELRLTGALPSPSAVGLRVLEITKEEAFDLNELTQAIMVDPALSGRIIKLANSVLRGGVESVESVPLATARLGGRTVRSVALGFTLISDNRNGRAEAFDYEGFWSQSLATAVACNALAAVAGGYEAKDAFTCGLLCDVGMLALACVHPERYSALLESCPGASSRDLADLEDQAFDINHYEVSAAMLEDWGLPRTFQHAVLIHERQEPGIVVEDETIALAKLLCASKAIAKLVVRPHDETDPEWCQAFFGLEFVAESLGMQHDELIAACDKIGTEWEEWGKLVGVPATVPFSFVELSRELVESEAQANPPAPTKAPVVNTERFLTAVATPSLDGAAMPSGAAVEAGPTRILLIDDDVRMLKLISHHLKREGYDVTTATSSDEGLRYTLEIQPQIVITDWMMPGMSGVKLCATLRKSEAGRKMYVLIVTAREDDEQVVEAFTAGADDYVVKPFNPRILIARVRAGQRMIRMREQLEAAEHVRLRQVAELGILTRKLRAAAMTDALTELPNRRYAMKRLKQEWDSSIRTGRPLSVVMADIDFFKNVNDQYGHDAGDQVLREVASVLRMSSRSGDILCRLGGEEFLSINMACTAEEAVNCAERLRSAMDTHQVGYPGFSGRVTLSLGVAERRPEMRSFDDLIKAADEALYAAKDQGRNCVVLDGEVHDPLKKLSA